MGVTGAAVLAIDGGNSKTEVALATADGTVLACVQVGGFTPHLGGISGAVSVAGQGVAMIRAELGLPADQPVAELLAAYVAGADFPVEVEALTAEFAGRGWAERTIVDNDSFALMRSGTSRPWGVAVVCGAGMNCVGIAPDGRHARFPAIGTVSGDWGGGPGIGETAHWYAVRAEDGRGAPTVLRKAVAEYFGCASMAELVEAIHFGRIADDRFGELAPLVFEVAGLGDEVALSIVERLADEVCALAFAAMGRLDLMDSEVEVVLGGGVLRARQPLLTAGIDRRFAERAPRAVRIVAAERPIHGAVLLGLDELARR
ncbi:N-acetylglucosamine kinase [Catenulispora rubra]|uniref:N-acetylglucosamine kinase n=1 Tax=Catenulispora rubra TaxID=280293 RepID=UPI0018927DAE|nr:BadF/BadG/BcrA/BcrD ATPase family protein [Catenulispora rubra]